MVDLKDRELPLGRILSRTGRSYYGALINRLASSGIDRHFSVLLVIEQDFPNTSQKEIAARLGLDKAMIARMIHFLMKKKYITRKPNLNDKREYCISLTSAGREKIPQIRKGIQELNRQCRKGITEDAWNSFHETIFRLHENLTEIPSSKLIVQYRRPKISGRK